MIAVVQARDDLVRGLLSREVEKEFLDVLDLERSLLEAVLLERIFDSQKRVTISEVEVGGWRLEVGGWRREAGGARRRGEFVPTSNPQPPASSLQPPASNFIPL